MNIEVFSTPNTIGEYLELAHSSKWSGTLKISVSGFEGDQWNIYFRSGQIKWCAGGEHWRRRWRRLVYQYCPHISLKNISLSDSGSSSCADYYQLKDWVERGWLMLGQAKIIIQNNLVEVLFDLIQKESRQKLIITTDKLDKLNTYLPAVDLDLVLTRSKDNWNSWCEAGLEYLSPNYAPALQPLQQKKLLHHVNLKLYRELVEVIDGEKSLRDIALLLKQPLLCVGLSLSILFQQELIQMYAILDLPVGESFSPLSPRFNISVEDFLSNSGVICTVCGCGSNSLVDSICNRCKSPLATKVLPPTKRFNISKKSLVPLLLVLLLGGGYFVWRNWEWHLIVESSVSPMSQQTQSNCAK